MTLVKSLSLSLEKAITFPCVIAFPSLLTLAKGDRSSAHQGVTPLLIWREPAGVGSFFGRERSLSIRV